jgi:hypothetical protein
MPVPEHSSPVNERPTLLLSVDNSKGEVLKNRAAAEPELFTITVVNVHKNQWRCVPRLNIGDCSRPIDQ